MSQATRPNDRHIIWSNQNLDVDDWREDYKEFLEANELDDDPNDEQALYHQGRVCPKEKVQGSGKKGLLLS